MDLRRGKVLHCYMHIVGLGNGTIDLYFGKVMTYDHEQYDNQPKT